jgi:hypothetical protein
LKGSVGMSCNTCAIGTEMERIGDIIGTEVERISFHLRIA